MPKNFDLGPTHDIQGVEIFASGTWNGDTYTVEDLDSIVAAYSETRERMKPYLKLGHDNKQKILQKDGYPAAGYIDGLRRVGNKLVADFVKVPKVVYDLLNVGGYRRVSSELFINMPVAGKVYKFVLKAVALLGGDTPAVQSLKDVIALYAADPEVAVFDEDATPTKVYEIDGPKAKEEDAVNELEIAQKKLAEAQARIVELEGSNAKITELTQNLETATARVKEVETENTALSAKVKQFSDDKNKAEINATVEKLIADKKINPVQKEAAFTLLMDAREKTEKKYKLGDKEISHEEFVLNFFQNSAAGLSTEDQSKQGDPHGDPTAVVSTDKLEADVKQWMEKNPGKSYKEALVAVSPEGTPNTGEKA